MSLKLESVNEKTVASTLHSQSSNTLCEADTALFPEGSSWPLLGWEKKERREEEKKKEIFHPALRQPLDLHVEVLMGVRCAPNQRNMAGNVREPKQGELGLQEL